MELNPSLTDLDLIQAGDVIVLPCTEDASKGDSIADLLARRSNTRVLFRAAVAAGLTETLSDPKFEATLFAPDDEAFGKLLTTLNTTASELLGDVDLLTTVLSYHVIPGVAAKGADLEDRQKLPTLLDGESLEIRTVTRGGLRIATGSRQRVRLGDADLDAGAAVVHIVKSVLIPSDIELPEEGSTCTHVVGEGESLFEIASRYSTTVDDLLELNQELMDDPNSLQPDTEITVFPNC